MGLFDLLEGGVTFIAKQSVRKQTDENLLRVYEQMRRGEIEASRASSQIMLEELKRRRLI